MAGVTTHGPADNAHIQNGDVILSFNGQKLHEMRTLPRVVAETPIDTKVPLELWRAGHRQTIEVVVAEMPEDAKPVEIAKQVKPSSQTLDLAALGLTIAPVSEELRTKYKLDEKQKGVVVTDVAANGTAADRGLKAGDVIVEVQQQPVATPVDVQKRLPEARDQSRKSVLLLVQGKDGMRWVPLPVKK